MLTRTKTREEVKVNATNDLSFETLEAMDAPDDGYDWFLGFSQGVALGLIALSLT